MKVLICGINEPLVSTINQYIDAFKREGHEVVRCGPIQGITTGNETDPNAPDFIYANTAWNQPWVKKYQYEIPVRDRPYPNYYSYQEILDRCPWKPDLIVQVEPHFFFKGTRSDRHGIPVAYLTFDNHRGPLVHLDAVRNGDIDRIFINSLHFMRPYTDALGADKVTWLPVAANPVLHHPCPDVQEQCDISWIGNPGWMDSGPDYDKWLDKTGARSQSPHNDRRFFLWHDESVEMDWQKQMDFAESPDNLPQRLGEAAPWEKYNGWEHREYIERAEHLYRLFKDFKMRVYCAIVLQNYARAICRGRIGFNCSLRNDINMKLFEYAACVPEGGTVLNSDSPRSIEEVEVGATVNSYTGYSKVLKTFTRDYSGIVIKIKPRNLLPFLLTPEHPILIAHAKGIDLQRQKNTMRRYRGKLEDPISPNLEWVSATEVRKGDYLVIPRTMPDPKDMPTLENTVNGRLKKYSDVQFYKEKGFSLSEISKLADVPLITAYEWLKNGRKPRGHPSDLTNGEIKLDEEFANFFGWYVAEGSASNTNYEVQISLGKDEEDIAQDIISFVTRRLGYKTRTRRVESSLNVLFSSKTVSKFLNDNFGKGAANKKIPRWMLTSENNVLKAFLKAYFKGDGYQNKKNNCIQWSTVSKTLAYQTMLALTRFGIIPSIFVTEPHSNVMKNRTVSCKKKYILIIGGKNIDLFDGEYNIDTGIHSKHSYIVLDKIILLKIFQVSKEYYSGKVHNLETSDSTYSLPAIVHNCGKMMVTDYVEGLDQLMPPGTGWIYYKKYYDGDNINFNLDYAEVRGIVDLYLKHEDQRREIAKRGMEHILKFHTYQHRVRTIIREMFKQC